MLVLVDKIMIRKCCLLQLVIVRKNINLTMFSFFQSLILLDMNVKGKMFHPDYLLNDLQCQMSGWHICTTKTWH